MTMKLFTTKLRHGADMRILRGGIIVMFLLAMSPVALAQAAEVAGVATKIVDTIAQDASVVKMCIWLTMMAMAYSGGVTWILVGQSKEMVRAVDRLTLAMSRKPCLIDMEIERSKKE